VRGSPHPSCPSPPGTHLLHDEILDRLGVGAMEEMWRARGRRLGREVAVKVLPAVAGTVKRDPAAV